MENHFSDSVVIIKFAILILTFISTSSGHGQSDSSNFTSSEISNESSQLNLYLNNKSNHNILNSTHQKLDKVFGLDSRIFEEYLKQEDLSIIAGLRKSDDFDNWIPPVELQRDNPVYMSGFDYQDRPIWVIEFGKWRFDKYATMGAKKAVLFDKYMRYLEYTVLKSLAIRSTKEHRITQYVSITDFQGFLGKFLLVIRSLIKVFSNHRRFAEKYVARTININVNPVAEILSNIIHPLYNRLLGNIEIYGTSKYIWAPQLLQNFPKDQIPEWYGGNKGYVPFHIFGSTHIK